MARQLEITQHFDLELSLTMGQAFRWRRYGDGWFSGVIGDHLIHIRQTDGGVEYRAGGADGETDADLGALLSSYFRLDDDIAAIYADLGARDPHIATLTRQYPGMRVLRQEPWECLVSYICSANNNIKRISDSVEAIAQAFGQPLQLAENVRCTFPTASRLTSNSDAVATLDAMRLGLNRANNIVGAAMRVGEGELDLDELKRRPYPEVMHSLMQGSRKRSKANGIGPKIADCVALMALDKTEAFPVDTHIKNAIRSLYFSGRKLPPDARLVEWAQGYFGPYAGYAGQYLFHGIEPHK